MAKSLPIKTVQNIRAELQKYVSEYEETIHTAKEEIEDTAGVIKTKVKNYVKSDKVPHKVANQILKDGKIKKSEALVKIHMAMYPLQELITNISIDYFPNISEKFNTMKSLLATVKVEMINHTILASLDMSNKDKEREVEFIMVRMTHDFNTINAYYSSTKHLIKWLNEQLDYLNRLDSMIRLKNKIDESVVFESMNSSLEL